MLYSSRREAQKLYVMSRQHPANVVEYQPDKSRKVIEYGFHQVG
jgi:hypothetical protein